MYFVNAQHFYDWNRGRNHVNFRGGPFPYGEGWPQIADAIRQRDRVCRRCGKTPEANGRALDVHHVVPFRASRDNSPENLVALCMICHREVTRLEEIEYAPYYATPRACLVCGSDFYPENPRVKLCSPACVRERQRERGRARDHRRSTRKTEYMRRWRAQNREHVNAYARQRKARRRQAQTGPDQTP
ncbi:MAG TPA: HNH endonuclease signature motif containing protein [Chloroflexota bacterium]|nr:HNH endonuclease signature motif containing protein [Chloroflexota bacterium]